MRVRGGKRTAVARAAAMGAAMVAATAAAKVAARACEQIHANMPVMVCLCLCV